MCALAASVYMSLNLCSSECSPAPMMMIDMLCRSPLVLKQQFLLLLLGYVVLCCCSKNRNAISTEPNNRIKHITNSNHKTATFQRSLYCFFILFYYIRLLYNKNQAFGRCPFLLIKNDFVRIFFYSTK